MKTQLLTPLFLLVLMIRSLYAQLDVTIDYEKQFGGSNDDLTISAHGIAENGLEFGEPARLAGQSFSDDGDLPGNSGLGDAWGAIHFGEDLESSINYGGSGDDAFGFELTSEEFARIFLGHTKSPEIDSFHGGEDVYMVVVDTNGITQHERGYGGTGNERGVYFSPKIAGFHLAVSYGDMQTDGDWTGAIDYGFSDIGLFKLSDSYSIIDKKIFGTPGFDLAYDAYDNGNGITILASTHSSGGSFTTPAKGGDDILVFKVDENLSLNAEYRYGGTKVEYGYDIKPHPDGGFFVAGASWSNEWFFGNDNGGVRDISCTTDGEVNPNGIVFRADASGNIIWSQCLEGSDWDFVQSCFYQHPDILYVVGYTASNDVDFPGSNPGSYDCFVAALNANTGEKIWVKVYGGSGADYAYDIVRLYGGNLLTVNQTNSNDGDVASMNHGFADAWIVAFNNPTGIDEPSPVVELLAYPNPADKTVTIDLPSNKMADQIEVLNSYGQLLSKIFPDQRALLLDVTNYANGIYFVKIRQDQKTYYSRISVLR